MTINDNRIEIRKCTNYAQTDRYHESQFGNVIFKKVTIYIVRVNGKRVDSFLKFRNAQAKARELRNGKRNLSSQQMKGMAHASQNAH